MSVQCPFCGSDAVQAVSISERQLVDAVIASLLFGLAAGVVAGSKSRVVNACLQCGRQWVPGVSDIEALKDAYGLNGELGTRRHGERVRLARRSKFNPRIPSWLAIVVVLIVLGIVGWVGYTRVNIAHRIVGRWEHISYGRRTGQVIDFRRDSTVSFFGWEKRWRLVRDAAQSADFLCVYPPTDDCWRVEFHGDSLEYGFTTLLPANP